MTPHEFLAPVLLDPDVEDGYMKHYVPLAKDIAASLAVGAASWGPSTGTHSDAPSKSARTESHASGLGRGGCEMRVWRWAL
ncbi:MAG: hypothetical protein AAGK21_00450 [Bacteroidota bacterium]